MYLKHFEPDHSANEISEAFGISKDELSIIRERVIFCSIANLHQIRDLYGEEESDVENAPKSLRSVTGAMKRVFSMIDNDKEYEATIMYILSFSQMARAAFDIYLGQKKENSSSKDKKSKEDVSDMLLTMLKKLKKESQSDSEKSSSEEISFLKDGEIVYDQDTMMKRVELVKKSCYNFDYYLNMINPDWGVEMPKVDDIIKSAFMDTDDDSSL